MGNSRARYGAGRLHARGPPASPIARRIGSLEARPLCLVLGILRVRMPRVCRSAVRVRSIAYLCMSCMDVRPLCCSTRIASLHIEARPDDLSRHLMGPAPGGGQRVDQQQAAAGFGGVPGLLRRRRKRTAIGDPAGH